MEEELIDICDENMTHVGEAMKSLAHRTGLWHEAIHCWFVRRSTSGGHLLFQKRAADKALFPDYLDITAAGHYQAGEVVQDGVREILEELGHEVAFSDLIPLGIKIDLGKTATILNHEFCHVFLYETHLEIQDFKLDRSEVEGLVEIEIVQGLALFSGEAQTATARGLEWDRKSGSWRAIEAEVGKDKFIPRIDSYYYKMFINADRYLAGFRHLAI